MLHLTPGSPLLWQDTQGRPSPTGQQPPGKQVGAGQTRAAASRASSAGPCRWVGSWEWATRPTPWPLWGCHSCPDVQATLQVCRPVTASRRASPERGWEPSPRPADLTRFHPGMWPSLTWAESALSTGGHSLYLESSGRRVSGSTVGVASLQERPRTAQEGGARPAPLQSQQPCPHGPRPGHCPGPLTPSVPRADPILPTLCTQPA